MFIRNALPYLIMTTGSGGGSEGGGGSGGGSGSGEGGGEGGGSGSGGGSGGSGSGSGSGGSGNGSGSGGGNSGGGNDHRGSGSPDRRRKLEDLNAEELRTYVRELREESADHRTKRTAAEEQNATLLAGIANMLGLGTDGKPDPERVAADLATASERVRTLETELAVRRCAEHPDIRADAAALLDSRSFMDDVHKIDRSASDYDTLVTDKIKTAMQGNPRLAAGSGGGDGGSGFFRGAIGQQTPGSTSGSTGVAAGRELRRARTARTRTNTTNAQRS